MIVATMKEGQAEFAKLVDAAVAGEEVFISRDGKRVVRLMAFEPEAPLLHDRVPGRLAGQGFWVSPDFDAPDPELIASFEDGEI